MLFIFQNFVFSTYTSHCALIWQKNWKSSLGYHLQGPQAGLALPVFELHTDGLTQFAGQRTSWVKFGVLIFSVILSLSRVPRNKWKVCLCHVL